MTSRNSEQRQVKSGWLPLSPLYSLLLGTSCVFFFFHFCISFHFPFLCICCFFAISPLFFLCHFLLLYFCSFLLIFPFSSFFPFLPPSPPSHPGTSCETWVPGPPGPSTGERRRREGVLCALRVLCALPVSFLFGCKHVFGAATTVSSISPRMQQMQPRTGDHVLAAHPRGLEVNNLVRTITTIRVENTCGVRCTHDQA